MSTLFEIEERIERRVFEIRAPYPDWLCRRGCDGCCHRLAELPLITRVEWLRLKKGLLALDLDMLQKIRADIMLFSELEGPVRCPMLDPNEGACRVYPERPLACRSYGYYTQRGIGLYCKQIESEVDAGHLDRVVWGNQDAIERDLLREGPPKSIVQWIVDSVDGIA